MRYRKVTTLILIWIAPLSGEMQITSGGIVFHKTPTLFYPEKNQDIIDLIDLAKKNGRKIRAIGSMHSLNPSYVTDDYMISLNKMNKVLEVGADYCTVQAGIVIRDLCNQLDQHGLTLGVLGSIAEQTIAGAISTGTRGQIPVQGSLASLITHLEIIDGEGHVKNISLKDEVVAYATSMGLLGVITKVTIACRPLYLMAEILRRMPMSQVIEQMNSLLASEKMVLYWNVDGEEVKVITGHRLDCNFPSSELVNFKMLGNYPHMHSLEGFPDTIQRIGKSWEINTLLHWTKEKDDRRIRNMKLEQEGIFQGDYSVPQEQFAEVIEDIRKFFRENRHRLKLSKDRMVVEIRPVKADNVWLSPSYGRDSFSLCFHDFARGLDWSVEDATHFIEFEQILKKYDVRPHLGKAHFFNNKDLEKAFPKWNEFKKLRENADPSDLFLTDYFHFLIF